MATAIFQSIGHMRKTSSSIETVALAHRGFVREVNEDRHYVRRLDAQSMILAVVDGMGGG